MPATAPSFPSSGTPKAPPGMTYLAIVRPSLAYALIAAIFSSLLIPIFVALLVFANRSARRRPIFILNVIAVVIGIGEGILLVTVEVHDILSPMDAYPGGIITAWFVLTFFTPLLVESILLLRLAAVFPAALSRRRTLAAVLALPFIIKTARIVNLCMATNAWVGASGKLGSVAAGHEVWGVKPYAKIEWILALVDNTYSSFIFIYRLRKSSPAQGVYRGTVAQRLHGLFLISVSNFVFPCLMSLAQLILLFRDPSFSNTQWFLDCSYVNLANNYVTIAGVVFATVWAAAGGSSWASDDKGNGSDGKNQRGMVGMAVPSFVNAHVLAAGPTGADYKVDRGRAPDAQVFSISVPAITTVDRHFQLHDTAARVSEEKLPSLHGHEHGNGGADAPAGTESVPVHAHSDTSLGGSSEYNLEV